MSKRKAKLDLWPTQLLITRVEEAGAHYFVAWESIDDLTNDEDGEIVRVYQLVATKRYVIKRELIQG